MKHLAVAVSIILCICLSLTACSNKSQPSVSDISDTLIEFSSSDIDWKKLRGDQLSSYFGFDDDAATDYEAYINGSEEHFDMIVAIQPTDNEARTEIIKGLTFAMTTASSNYKNTNETEYKKITAGRIVETGDILILVIMDNYDKINEYFEELGAKAPQS